jgi:hypothetical protein
MTLIWYYKDLQLGALSRGCSELEFEIEFEMEFEIEFELVTGWYRTSSILVDPAPIPTVELLFPTVVLVFEMLFGILELLSALFEERFDPPPPPPTSPTSPTSLADVFVSTFVTKAFTCKPTAPAITINLSIARRLGILSVVPVLGGMLSRRSEA